MDDNTDRAGVLVRSWNRPGETITIWRLPAGGYQVIHTGGPNAGITNRPNESLATVAALCRMTADWTETTTTTAVAA